MFLFRSGNRSAGAQIRVNSCLGQSKSCADFLCTRNGTQVLLSHLDPLQEVPLRGTIMASNATQLRIVFDQKFDIDDGPWRLDVGRSNIIFERMRAAILHFNHDPAVLETSQTPDRQFVMQGTHLRDVFLRSFSPASTSLHQPLQAPDEVEYVSHETLEHQSRDEHEHSGAFKDDMRIQSWARRYALPNPIEMDGDPVLDGLNPTQIRAVAMMIGEPISLVQGVSPSFRNIRCGLIYCL